MTANLAAFLRFAHAGEAIAARVAAADTYQSLAALAVETGFAVTAADLEAAFRERNASVLGAQMIRARLVPMEKLPHVPELDRVRFEQFLALDLSPVFDQLVNRKGWTPERAAGTEYRYRCFYYLLANDRQFRSVPTEEIDEFWHQHILNTRKYAADCQQVAGRFLHHNPSFGANADEIATLESGFFDMWVAFETMFNFPYQEALGVAFLRRWPNVAQRAAA